MGGKEREDGRKAPGWREGGRENRRKDGRWEVRGGREAEETEAGGRREGGKGEQDGGRGDEANFLSTCPLSCVFHVLQID